MQIPVYILAGGHSSRFGSDKARALFRGRPLLSHVARVLKPHAQSLTVVANIVDKYDDLQMRTIADRIPDKGPVGGLQRAFEDLKEEGWLLLTCCDLLGIQRDWIEMLLNRLPYPGDVIAFRGNYWEPLLALYHSRMKSRIDQCITTPNPTLWRVIEQCDSLSVPLPVDFYKAAQINTPDALLDYARRDEVLDEV